MNQKRVGQLLRESREEKKLSIQDVAKDTNIAAKFIVALENEDYFQFPGETFILGFLKNYGQYLKLDLELLINLYRGKKIAESEAPLEQLTRPTSNLYYLKYLKFDQRVIGIILSAVFVIFCLYFIFSGESSQDGEESTEGQETSLENNVPGDIRFIQKKISQNTDESLILLSNSGVTFDLKDNSCKMFLEKVTEEEIDETSTKVAHLGLMVYPNRIAYKFKMVKDEEVVLSSKIEELSSLNSMIKLKLNIATKDSIKLNMFVAEGSQSPSDNASVNPIQVNLFFNKSSYAEFIIDGNKGFNGVVEAGEVKTLEAQNRLEIKVGDGSGVEMIQNGKTKTVLGIPGKVVKKVFVRVPNPYDSTQFIIKELNE